MCPEQSILRRLPTIALRTGVAVAILMGAAPVQATPVSSTLVTNGRIVDVDPDAPVSLAGATFKVGGEEFSNTHRPRISLFLTFHNSTEKMVSSMHGVVTIKDSFGREIDTIESDLRIQINPGEDATALRPISWDDEPLREESPYNRLSGSVHAGLVDVSATITNVVYDNFYRGSADAH